MPHTTLDASVTINAPAKVVFKRLAHLASFDDWNPFPEMDNTTVSTHEGPASGVGSIFQYEGKRLGKGRMEIVAVDAPRQVDIKMTFWRGTTESHSRSAFVVVEAENGVDVHWTFDEDRGFGMYVMGKLMFDRMMTGSFESGLRKLKALIEADAPAKS